MRLDRSIGAMSLRDSGAILRSLCSNWKVMGAMERFGVGQNILPSCRVEVGLEKMDQPRNMVAT